MKMNIPFTECMYNIDRLNEGILCDTEIRPFSECISHRVFQGITKILVIYTLGSSVHLERKTFSHSYI